MIPAASSFSRACGTSVVTIAESPGSRPRPARKRLASARSCAWISSTPMRLISSSAGAVPTQENQAGEVSKRRASAASLSGGPKVASSGSSVANQPAWAGTSRSASAGSRTMNAVPRGHISHL
jgi:hypothetical protein